MPVADHLELRRGIGVRGPPVTGVRHRPDPEQRYTIEAPSGVKLTSPSPGRPRGRLGRRAPAIRRCVL